MFLKNQKLGQIIFLSLFLVLLVFGKTPIWMGVIIVSALLAVFFGRFYCGYICPIKTTIDYFDKIFTKTGFRRQNIPSIILNDYLRITLFLLFILGIVFGEKISLPIPIILVFLLLAILTVIFYPAKVWHRHMCPFGFLFSFPARFTMLKQIVKKEACNGCGVCEKFCPGAAIKIDKNLRKAMIDPQYCLECFTCHKKCFPKAIFFGRNKFSSK